MKLAICLCAALLPAAGVTAGRQRHALSLPGKAGVKTALLHEKVSSRGKRTASDDPGGVGNIVSYFVDATPIEYTGLLFALFTLGYFLKTWLLDLPSAEDYHKARSSLIHQIKHFESKKRGWMKRLDLIEKSRSTEAEYTFVRRQDELQTHLSSLAQLVSKEHGGSRDRGGEGDDLDIELVDPLRDFIKGWLQLLRQCSIDPIQEPYEICACQESVLDGFTRTSDIAEHVNKHLSDRPIALVAAEVECFRGQHLQRTESFIGGDSRKRRFWLTVKCGSGLGITSTTPQGGCAPFPIVLELLCCKVELLSLWHCRLLLYLIFGIALDVMLHRSGYHVSGTVVDVALLVLAATLLFFVNTINDHGRLVHDAAAVREEMNKAEETLSAIEGKVAKMDTASDLWRYQTLPRLKLYGIVMEILMKVLWQGREVAFSIANQMQHVDDAFASIDLWTGPSPVPVTFMKTAAKQLAASSAELTEALKSKSHPPSTKLGLHNIFALVTVVVLAAHNLPDMDEGVLDLTDASIVVKVGKERRRTKTIKDCLNPRWTSEKFIMLAASVDTVIKLEVYDQVDDEGHEDDEDENDDAGKHRNPHSHIFEPIGYVEVPLRAKPGEWVWKKEKIRSYHNSRKPAQGEVEFRFHFARTVSDLSCMRPTVAAFASQS